MGNNSSTPGRNDRSRGSGGGGSTTEPFDDSDFEPIDKPTSPTFMNVSIGGNPNDLSASGVLVEMTEEDSKDVISKRRIVKATTTSKTKSTTAVNTSNPVILSSTTIPDTPKQTKSTTASSTSQSLAASLHHQHHAAAAGSKSLETDEELLNESLQQDRQQRLIKLQNDQRAKRNKAVESRRKQKSEDEGTSKPVPQANPFSQFLSAFSVQPKFPSHKRAYEPSAVDYEDEEPVPTNRPPRGTKPPPEAKMTIHSNVKDGPVDTKRPKLDESMASTGAAASGGDGTNSEGPLAQIVAATSLVVDWLDENIPAWPWVSAASAAVVVFMVLRPSRR